MLKKIIKITSILLCFSHNSFASSPPEDGRSSGRSSLLRSFVKEDTRSSQVKKLEDISSPFLNVKHKHNTMYLTRTISSIDPTAMSALRKCFATYCFFTIREKRYSVDANALDLLSKEEVHPIGQLSEYKRLIRLSQNMNSLLPSRDTSVLCHLRRPFSYFWPSIDLYDDMMKIRAHAPLAADYLEYLFKVNESDESIQKTVSNLHQRVETGMLNAGEQIAIFCMHIFGHGDQKDMELAKKEAEKMQKVKILWPNTFYNIMKSFDELMREFDGAFGGNQTKVDEISRLDEIFSLYLGEQEGEAEEINLDYETGSDDFELHS